MAYVLSLPASNPFERPFVEPLGPRSHPSITSHLLADPIYHSYPKSRISCSLQSRASCSHDWPLPEQGLPSELDSPSIPKIIHNLDMSSTGRFAETEDIATESKAAQDIVLQPSYPGSVDDFAEPMTPFPPFEYAVRDRHDSVPGLSLVLETAKDDEFRSLPEAAVKSPFKKWLSTLRRRHAHRPQVPRYTVHMPAQFNSPRSASTKTHGHHKQLSFTSSIGLITAVKSASMTLAGTSIAPGSRHSPRRSHLQSDATSTSYCDPRVSMDSGSGFPEPTIDSKAWYRSIQRRNIVEEILSSEESYISDMKAMIHMYFTLLASAPALSPRRRESIQRSIGQIVQLHEELLVELQKVVPNARQLATHSSPDRLLHRSGHTRWHSIDTMPLQTRSTYRRRRLRHSFDTSRPSSPNAQSMMVTTSTALNVARVFHRFMRRFLTYEAYVAHHEIMQQEAFITTRLVPAWSSYERGVEALNASTTTIEQREAYCRKGLTLSDLGIKPIQRICKYPLFFADLCKQTPTCDDPVAHAELEKVLSRLHETAQEINDAMDNPRTRQLIETTWILQDRLSLRHKPQHTRSATIRHFGHVILCGALHVAYETPDGFKGHYMICVLYRSWLILATVGHNSGVYCVNAVIPLLHATIEAPDNGRGLQCHTALYTWKFVFQHEHKYHEVLMSACSDTEEEVWKRELRMRVALESRDVAEGRHNGAGITPYLQIDIKAVGPAFEAQDGFTHRVSIRRAATLGPKTNLRQVIIKNTHAMRAGQNGFDDVTFVVRSKSHMSSSTMATLAPRRSERIRLEGILADVWSRDSLPYPGMATRRPENPIRASASSVMRKLSMASIASNFSIRSASFSSASNYRPEEPRASSQRALYRSTTKSRRLEKPRPRVCGPTMVDFHNAPSAFLPEDFELRKPTLTVRGQNFMKRAMTMEGSRSPPNLPVFLPRISPTEISTATLMQAYAPVDLPQDGTDSGMTPRQTQSLDSSSQPTTSKPPVTAMGLFYKLLGVNKDERQIR